MAETDELGEFRLQLRSWLERNLSPRSTALPSARARGTLPAVEHLEVQRALQRKLFEAGYAGITWPREFGGAGLTPAHQQVFDDEAAPYELPDFAPLHNTTFGVCGPTLLAHAGASFKAVHIPRILTGDELWAQFFSEPEAGSDLAGIRTRAERVEGGWSLRGSKVWTSGAQYADYGMCLARTNWSVPKHQGLTWFAVPTDVDGLTIRPIREINGGEEFCEEFLDQIFLTDDARIGEVDDGWTVATTMLGFERTAGKPARSGDNGPGQIAPDLVRRARERQTLNSDAVRQLVARAHANDFVVEQLGRYIGDRVQSAGSAAGLASYVKLAAGTFTPERARIALEIGGASAVTWAANEPDAGVAAAGYLNARLRSIAGGTNEMQRNAIAERVLGLPRETNVDRDKPFSEVLRDSARWGHGS